eukprot:scaffold5085_cov73-Phaeocystis_antarctica.AAC.2
MKRASLVARATQTSTYLTIAGLVGKVGRHTPRLLVNRERVGERGTAGGRGLGRPFDFERAHAHSNDVLYQGDCDAGVRELAAALGWQHELERMCSQAGAVHRAPPRVCD